MPDTNKWDKTLVTDMSVTAVASIVGEEIDTTEFDFLTFYIDYTKGGEASCEIYLILIDDLTDSEFQEGQWSSGAGTKTYTANEYQMSASAKRPISFDVRGVRGVKLYQKATGGTPSGTISVSFMATR